MPDSKPDPTQAPPGRTAIDPPLGVFLAVARLSPDAIIVAAEHDSHRFPVWANPGVAQLLGYSFARLLEGGLAGLAAQTMGEADDDASDGDPLQGLLADQGGTADLILRRADGSTMLARVSTTPVPLGEATYWALTIREIEA